VLFGLGAVIAISSFQELWARNVLAWCVALALFIWGNASYLPVNPNNADLKKRALQAIAWASPRSYCAFLIHFAFILLANTIYIASGLYMHANGTMAIGMMVLVVQWKV
ncbi:MAG: acyltransferase, partial [Polynucleobacter sp. 39-45-136]